MTTDKLVYINSGREFRFDKTSERAKNVTG
jgi:hypothetical protein